MSVDKGYCSVMESSAADGKLTLIIGVLEVVVNGGHKFLHKITTNIRRQGFFTLQFTL